LKEPRKFIQILFGSRQTGKTTLIRQVLKEIKIPSLYLSADNAGVSGNIWIEQQWNMARLECLKNKTDFILVIDEVQKISGWSETVKKMWDSDTKDRNPIKVVLLGSAPLLIQKGLTETLTGRFEVVRLPHWSYKEMKDAFDFSLNDYIYFGGYPGSAELIHDYERWKNYIKDSIIETTILKDVLLMTRIDKPGLLKHLFELGCIYSGQILSFNKILGQLQDAGNTVTLSHYLNLLSGAGMLTGIQKYSAGTVTVRSSSPKFMVFNSALFSVYSDLSPLKASENTEKWGQFIETAVGSHLLNSEHYSNIKTYYWRQENHEVDFILKKGRHVTGLEVKSGKSSAVTSGMIQFKKKYPGAKIILTGEEGISVKDFLLMNPGDIF
jgi:uncharacterized protein